MTVLNKMSRARVTIASKRNNSGVDLNVEKSSEEYIDPREVAAKRWSSSRIVYSDEEQLKLKFKYGALTV